MLLQTKAFHKIPPANIQAIFMRMQQINYRSGDVILKQGAECDYFYVLIRGSALVTRETPLSKEGIKLAELQVGDTFGEEALISDAKRNATVTMQSDGAVMRLGKDDFKKLLNEPMLDWVTMTEAEEVIRGGGRKPRKLFAAVASGWMSGCQANLRISISTMPLTSRCISCV
jgi:CRP-like cAMP-binding protein